MAFRQNQNKQQKISNCISNGRISSESMEKIFGPEYERNELNGIYNVLAKMRLNRDRQTERPTEAMIRRTS